MTRIGIIAGSGPEAGIDLWRKTLDAARRLRGDDYRGDLDAPAVHVVSEPRLGLSMDLARHHDEVWTALVGAGNRLGAVDVIGIACNTLNLLAGALDAHVEAEVLDVGELVRDELRAAGVERVGLLAARPVAQLGDHSVYRRLTDSVEVVTPPSLDRVHELIERVKRIGPDPRGRDELDEMVASMQVDTVLLACTELPLLVDTPTDDRANGGGAPPMGPALVDVTQLLADTLAVRAGCAA